MPDITDVTLCTISYASRQAREVLMLYSALLELGVSFVQIPVSAVPLLGDCLVRERTVLAASAGDGRLAGFAGYVSNVPVKQGRCICEIRLADRMPEWADEVRITADASLFMSDYHAEFSRMRSTPNVTFCAKNAGQAGSALAVEWLTAGGDGTALSFLGSGGYAPLEQVLAALHAAGAHSFRLEKLAQVADAWKRLTGQSLPKYAPVVGGCIFDVESGTHVDGILKNSRCYEPFSPEDVGGQRRIAIGKHSGKAAIRRRLKELDIDTGCDIDKLLELVREASMESGGAVSDSELKALAARAGGEDAA